LRKNRYLLCLLLCGLMLYFAAPRLSITAPGAEGIFSIAWLLLILMAIAGNLSAMLYTPKRERQGRQTQQAKKKSRSFYS